MPLVICLGHNFCEKKQFPLFLDNVAVGHSPRGRRLAKEPTRREAGAATSPPDAPQSVQGADFPADPIQGVEISPRRKPEHDARRYG